jgi:hypothetical protein
MGRKPTGRRSGAKSGKTRKKSGAATGAGPERSGTQTPAQPGTEPALVATPDRLTPENSAMDLDSTPELSPEAVNLQLEADAAIAGAEPAALTDIGLPPPAPIDAEAEFKIVLDGPLKLAEVIVLPQWGITTEEHTELTASLSMCLAQLFPDGINGKYACWFRLIACSGLIVVTRAAQNGGKLPGIGPKKPDPDPTPVHGQALAA